MNLIDALLLALYVQIPVVIGGVLHMLVVSRQRWPALAVPVHAALFGANKTWRGFVVVPLATALGALCLLPLEWMLGDQAVFIATCNAAAGGLCSHVGISFANILWLMLIGLAGGFGYVLAELPNSWFKRRLGIAPGATPARHRRVFIAMDQIDSGIGVALVWAVWPGLPVVVCVLYVLTFPLTALGVKRLLFAAKLKQSAV